VAPVTEENSEKVVCSLSTPNGGSRRKRWRRMALAELARTGNVTAAAQKAGVTRDAIYKAARRSPRFKRAMDDALEASKDVIDLEIYRRAVEGVEKPRYYKGQICGMVREYSDRLLTLMAKARDPRYRDPAKAETSGAGPTVIVQCPFDSEFVTGQAPPEPSQKG